MPKNPFDLDNDSLTPDERIIISIGLTVAIMASERKDKALFDTITKDIGDWAKAKGLIDE